MIAKGRPEPGLQWDGMSAVAFTRRWVDCNRLPLIVRCHVEALAGLAVKRLKGRFDIERWRVA